jgi:heat shock protein HslJ
VSHGQLFASPHDVRYKQCTDAVGEQTFGERGLDLLTGGPRYTVEGAELVIGAGSQSIHLRATADLPRPTLDLPTVTGATWVLTGVRDSRGVAHAVQGSPTFVIKNNELRASDGCNTLSGEAVLDGDTLTTGKGGGLRVTEIGCDQEVMATASVVDAVLNGEPTAGVGGATMVVRSPSAGMLIYAWQPDDKVGTEPALLESRAWRLTSIAGKPATAAVTLRIDGPDRISGNDGCTAFATAGNDIGPGTLQLGVAPKPFAQCTEPEATTVDSFLAGKPALWSIRDGKLLIFGGGAQAFSLVFTPSEPVPNTSVTPTPVGKAWTLSELSTEGANSGSGSATSASGVVLTIDANDFHLQTPCGNWDGGAYEKGDTITFDAVHDAGGPYCLNGEFGKAADQLVHGGSAKWSIKGGQLQLVQGNTTLTFDS